MKVLALAAAELRRYSSPLKKIAVGFLVVVPLLYGALYLWSNWDPYGRLDKVPVAVVNADQPVTFNGSTVDAGDRLVDELQQERLFDWHFTDAADAADGLAHGRYYLTITVPQDFSANLVSGAGTSPQRAVLLLHRDDVNGYVIGMLTASVQQKLESAVDEAAYGAYVDAVFGNLDEIRSAIGQAADGAGQLADGAGTAAAGSTKLTKGLGSARSGSSRLASGAARLDSGAQQLVSGIGTAKTGADKVAAGADSAHSGASTLATGAGTAADGASQLAAGLHQLHDGSAQLQSGADQVAAGNKQLADTASPILRKVVPILPQVTQAGVDLTSAVSDLTALASTDADALTTRSADADRAVAAFVKAHPELANDPALQLIQQKVSAVNSRTTQVAAAIGKVNTNAQKIAAVATTINENVPTEQAKITALADNLDSLAAGSQQVADGVRTVRGNLQTAATSADTLATGVSSLASGAAELRDGLGTLDSGATSLATGVAKLQTGATTLATGASSLHTGAAELDSGIATAVTGSRDLGAGIGKLQSGAKTLQDKLSSGAARIPSLTQSQQDAAAQVLSSPADAQMTIDHPAGIYGRGLAPFFFAIALWVFGITAFLVLRPTSGRALAGRTAAWRIALAGWLPVVGLAMIGGLLLLVVSWLALGLNPVNGWGSAPVVLLATVCFTAIAHLLRSALGLVGSAVTLVLLMVQLTTCGGLYPVETLPAPLRALHPFLPMSYLVDALRITFTGGPSGHLWRDVIVLAAIAAAALGGIIAVTARRKVFRMADLHPALG